MTIKKKLLVSIVPLGMLLGVFLLTQNIVGTKSVNLVSSTLSNITNLGDERLIVESRLNFEIKSAFRENGFENWQKAQIIFDPLDRSRNWWFSMKVRTPGENQSAKYVVKIIANAKKIDQRDLWTAVLSETQIQSGQEAIISMPLGIWAMRNDLKLTLNVRKLEGVGNLMFNYEDVHFYSDSSVPTFSIAQSNMVWEKKNPANQRKIIEGIKRFPGEYVRDQLNIDTMPIHKELSEPKPEGGEPGKKLLMNIGMDERDFVGEDFRAYEDVVEGSDVIRATAEFAEKCADGGSGHRRGVKMLSKINTEKLKERILLDLTAYAKEGVKIDAFEIGNELNWVCANGDLPLDRPVGFRLDPERNKYVFDPALEEQELNEFVKNYARYFKTAVSTIKNFSYNGEKVYEDAKIISFGIASPKPGYLDGRIKNLGEFLRKLSEYNFSQEEGEQEAFSFDQVDAIGLHLYPSPGDVKTELPTTLTDLNTGNIYNKPYWITETGFNNDPDKPCRFAKLTPQSTDAQVVEARNCARRYDRYRLYVDLFDTLLKIPNFKIDYFFNYGYRALSYDKFLANPVTFQELPEIKFFYEYQNNLAKVSQSMKTAFLIEQYGIYPEQENQMDKSQTKIIERSYLAALGRMPGSGTHENEGKDWYDQNLTFSELVRRHLIWKRGTDIDKAIAPIPYIEDEGGE